MLRAFAQCCVYRLVCQKYRCIQIELSRKIFFQGAGCCPESKIAADYGYEMLAVGITSL